MKYNNKGMVADKNTIYTFEHYPHFVRIKMFKCNVTYILIKTHTKCANLNLHRCIYI
jgi:hypothetical protein